MTKDLLVEIGTEELPPTSLRKLAESFAQGLGRQCRESGVAHGEVTSFCTPRRLAVCIWSVSGQQEERTISRKGPSVGAAFHPDGTPTKAAEGFARSCGVEISGLTRERAGGGEWLAFRSVEAARPTAALLPTLIERALVDLPVAKRMRWGGGDAEFVRPVHWVCVVLGCEPVEGKVLGVDIGNVTFGHRFHAPAPIPILAASQYAELLRTSGWVEASFERRRESISREVHQLAAVHGLKADVSEVLLDEVTGLVEWPRAVIGSFDSAFLSLPPEVLIETMQKNQKYFPVQDQSGRLQSRFIAIANIESKQPGEVQRGNERVLRPRFEDARFFWEQDLRQPLSSYFERLESVIFQERLGSIADKSRRVSLLAGKLASLTGEPVDLAERAGLLVNCDLVTAMVGEFPAVQGIMGRYYAQRSGEHPLVCQAIEEQYLPRFSGDKLPASGVGQMLALADRLDTLVGVFGTGIRPSGTKDPYGLRRASIAVLRILIEIPLELDLRLALAAAESEFLPGIIQTGATDTVLGYIFERLKGYYSDIGIPQDTVEAVVASGGTRLSQLDRRIRAVQVFRALPAGEALASASKRITNILAKTVGSIEASARPNPELFAETAEGTLWDKVCRAETLLDPLLAEQDFSGILQQLSELREDVDCFFESVMVMSEDLAVRRNRQIILHRLRSLFLNVADISVLQ